MEPISRRTLLAGSALAAVSLGSPTATATGDPITRWIAQNAKPITELKPGNAQIVGLGEAVHGTAEITRLKLRVVRNLVEQHGFRAIAFEDDWSLGTQLNDYIVTGRGDLHALMRGLSSEARTHEIAELFEYLRAYNATHRDKVRFAGTEYFSTRRLSYDAVAEYVARRAPHRLAELHRNLDPIRPTTDDMGAYVRWYWQEVKDKAPYVAKARAVYSLVRDLPHRPNDRDYAITEHHARQIRSFYTAFSLPDDQNWAYRDARAAENVRWWHSFTRNKVIYWAASAHTANAPHLRASEPPIGFRSAGSYLRTWYGNRYRSITCTFDHGTTLGPITMPPAPTDWFEHQLTATGLDNFLLDLHTHPQPPAVRTWLHQTAKTRGLPEAGPTSCLTGDPLSAWFDTILHTQTVTPTHPLTN
ncbi:erythromycin esterase family protein [Kribbella speibonae]|uniref:Erythromycin esterase family protein n=1 Tax=Kribbella speibonae TaxID=1572660 RepID=A0A4R0I946_9ACTN|nr:erythromycin esterase family protein [Kribbella speibonae]TCC29501.1 erythromycin esterase family protein [Kribbella speibonae]